MRTIENCNLLFQKNEAGSCFKVSQKYVIHHRGPECNGATMHRLIKEINGCLQKCSDRRLKIILDFGKVRFKDKLTYIILESICYSLIKDYGHIVVIRGECQEIRSKDIFCGGISCSPLRYLFIDKKENRDNFIRLFDKKCIEKNHYRRLVSSSEESSSPIFCTIMMEIRTFLSLFTDNDKYRKEVAEVVSELAGNAWEHAKSDCMIDIDVQEDFKKPGDPKDESYYGVNIVVINFAHVLLGDELKEKLMTRDDSALDGRCRQVKDAYSYHKNYFSDKYNVDDFFNIASFQDRVSSREDSGESGGRGLPLLIRSLERQADTHLCYVISGKNVIWFKLPYMEYNKDEWVGFNSSKNFLSDIPAEDSLGRGETFVSGTAFNLNFAMMKRRGQD